MLKRALLASLALLLTVTCAMAQTAVIPYTKNATGSGSTPVTSTAPLPVGVYGGASATSGNVLTSNGPGSLATFQAPGGSYSNTTVTATGAVTAVTQAMRAATIYNVRDWGALCNGSNDDTTAVQAAVTAMYALSPSILNFNNGTCVVSSTITLPEGGYVGFENGYIKASSSFTGSFLIATTGSDSISHHDLLFQNLYVDANQKTNGIKFDTYLRIIFKDSHIIHFTTTGVELDNTGGSHEADFGDIQIAEYLYGESMPSFTATDFVVNSPDNFLHDIVGSYSLDFINMNNKYNLVRGTHGYVNRYFLYTTTAGSWNSYIGNYIDSCGIFIENPWNTEFIGNKFLFNTDSAYNIITLQPQSIGLYLTGLKIVDNSFQNEGIATITPVYVDTSLGTFAAGHISEDYMVHNSFSGVTPMTTHPYGSLYQTGQTDFTFDFTSQVPFGAIQWQSVTFLADSSITYPIYKIKSVTNSVVVGSLNSALNGTMTVEGDVNASIH